MVSFPSELIKFSRHGLILRVKGIDRIADQRIISAFLRWMCSEFPVSIFGCAASFRLRLMLALSQA